MRRTRRLVAAAAAVPLLLGWMAGSAMADDISNDLDATVDSVAETMTLNVGGDAGTTSLYVTPRNGDGKNGCNLTGGTTLSLAVKSSDTAVATVSPSSVTFTSCGDTETLTVTPVTKGDATISVSQTSNNTGGSFNLAPATFTVTVAAPASTNTAPQISVEGVNGGASYAKGAVPAATCNVVDAEDGSTTVAATLSEVTGPYAADGIGEQTASCLYTDKGGLTTAASVTYSIVDLSAPTVDAVLSPAEPDGLNGWYTSDVKLAWKVEDLESPNSLERTGCEDQTITADQLATDYSCAATSAGGAAEPQTVSIKRDATAPAELAFVGGPTGDYYYGSDPAVPTCSASDVMSGLASCVVTGGGTSVGTHTYTATATDNAGNTSTATLTYEVLAWNLKGFTSPVNMGGVWNTVKGGSTVPLKFEVFAGTQELTSTTAIERFTVKAVTCPDSSAPADAVEFVTTGGTSLRYDATGGQFVQNWQTPKKPGTCYAVTMTTEDGSSITGNFQLK